MIPSHWVTRYAASKDPKPLVAWSRGRNPSTVVTSIWLTRWSERWDALTSRLIYLHFLSVDVVLTMDIIGKVCLNPDEWRILHRTHQCPRQSVLLFAFRFLHLLLVWMPKEEGGQSLRPKIVTGEKAEGVSILQQSHMAINSQ